MAWPTGTVPSGWSVGKSSGLGKLSRFGAGAFALIFAAVFVDHKLLDQIGFGHLFFNWFARSGDGIV